MTGRNDPCPCGSGKKYKKCCLPLGGSTVGFQQDDRFSAFGKLRSYAKQCLAGEREEALKDFYGVLYRRVGELGHELAETSEAVCDVWFYLDYELPAGDRVVDRLLEEVILEAGERRYLEVVRQTAMRLYEIESTVPGVSVTLRDLLQGSRVTIHERMGSRSMSRHDVLAARIIPRGPSMQPEMEPVPLQIPPMIRESVIQQLKDHLEEARDEDPGATDLDIWKALGPFFHEAWMKCLVDPQVPRIANTDGEEMIWHKVHFAVSDVAAVAAALDAAEGLEREQDQEATSWSWTRKNADGKIIDLGTLELEGGTLLFECNSADRAARGRALVESNAPGLVTYTSTESQNIRESVIADLKAKVRGDLKEEPEPPQEIPRDVQEALVLDHQAQYYRGWLDEKIPALDDRTPREASQDRKLRPRLIEMLKDLDAMYQKSLKLDEPAFDPSWMWVELGVEEAAGPDHPPPLAHERLAALVPGAGDLCRGIAEAVRKRDGFDDGSTTISVEEFHARTDVQRFLEDQGLRARLGHASDGGREDRRVQLEELLHTVTNHELHRRKVFWVDEALVYSLAKTDTDVPGRDLRAPFPSFAIVFTDRHVLSLGERLVSRDRESLLAGQFIRVATAYVTESGTDPDRRLRVVLAFDNLALDLPHTCVCELPLPPDASLHEFLESVSPDLAANELSAAAVPLGALLQLVFNAMLYATSPGVESREGRPPSRTGQTSRQPAERPFSSESVYFLPGAIEISQVRKLQELERVSSGRTLVHRFLVRGHWRRPPREWKDQRMRWIQPFWKGPSMAVTIEKAYKLKP